MRGAKGASSPKHRTGAAVRSAATVDESPRSGRICESRAETEVTGGRRLAAMSTIPAARTTGCRETGSAATSGQSRGATPARD